jgi:5-methylcytosine-specific restriction endonuclease McrA
VADAPSPTIQIQFLMNVQRLLAEGLFTSTYKYALLAALADLSVEFGNDSGQSLNLSTYAIAEKFTEYYWHHATPYANGSKARVLRQNTGGPAKILTLILNARTVYGDSLPTMMRDARGWSALVRKVESVVRQQPLWKLQTVGRERLEFLYGVTGADDAVELKPGVSYCFRQFYSLIQDAVRSAWLRDVRSLNGDLLGETRDLREFLFGAERSALGAIRPVLMKLQQGRCFYCSSSVREGAGQVDHFIPWSKYPIDLAHNLVLADNQCNNKKRDRMPHVEHLAKSMNRNERYGADLTAQMDTRFTCDLSCTNRIAHWAYVQTERAGGMTWLRGDDLRPLLPDWRNYLDLGFSQELGESPA